VLPNDDPRPEEEGYAGGGNIRLPGDPGPGFVGRRPREEEGRGILSIQPWREGEGHVFAKGGAVDLMPDSYAAYKPMKSDPVARRRYSPRHVGYAEGGFVDPMNYVPDRPEHAQPQQKFDEFNMVGRTDPMVDPMLTQRPTGYATGGPIAAAQVPAYTAPSYPAPSAENAKLYSDMATLREATINPKPLQMPALPSLNLPAASSAPDSGGGGGGGGGDPWIPPMTGTVVTPPKSNYNPNAGGGGSYFDMLFDQLSKNAYKEAKWKDAWPGYAEGGAVDSQAMPPPPTGPDAEGYLRGDNAMDPQQLDQVLQQIGQIDPSLDEDGRNLTAIVEAAKRGHMDIASSMLAGFRKRFDSLNAHAQGAVAHGDLAAAAQLAGKAHSQIPDGLRVGYAPQRDGSVIATVTPGDQSFQMSGQQFHDYIVGPGTSFDHLLENGLVKNLTIATGGQGGTPTGDTGYAAGGEEPPPEFTPEEGGGEPPPEMGPPPGPPPPEPQAPTGYAEGGEVYTPEYKEDDQGRIVQSFVSDKEEDRTARPPALPDRKGGDSSPKNADVRERGAAQARYDAAHNTFQYYPKVSHSMLDSQGNWANPQYKPGDPKPYAEGGLVEDDGGAAAAAAEEQRRQAEAAAQAQAAQEAAREQQAQEQAATQQRQPDTMGGANAPGMSERERPAQERPADMMGGAGAPGMSERERPTERPADMMGGANAPGMRELAPERPAERSPDMMGGANAPGMPDSKKTVQDVLAHTREQYGMGAGPSRQDIAGETAGLGLGRDRVAPLTGDETQLAAGSLPPESRHHLIRGTVQMGGGSFAKSSQPEREGTAGAGGVYYPPGYSVRELSGGRRGGGGGGGGGGGHRRSSGGGGGGGGGGRSRDTGGGGQQDGGGQRFSATHNDPNDSTSFTTRDLPQTYTTGYRQEPPTYTQLPAGTDLRRHDTAGNRIGPEIGQPVPPEANAPEPTRMVDTKGNPIGGFDSRPDPNTPEAYAKREFPNDPAGQNAILANFYLKGTQREYDALKRAGENRQLTPDMVDRLQTLEKGRQEATYDWDGFAKEKGLKSAEQIIEGLRQERLQGGGGGQSGTGGGVRTDRSGRTIGVNGPILREHDGTSRPGDEGKWHPKYGYTVLDADGWPTGIPRGGSFANVPWSKNRDYSEPITFGRTGHVNRVGRAGSAPVYDAGRSTYDVDLRTGRPRAAEGQMEGGWHGPRPGERGWSGTYPGGYQAPPPPKPPTYQTRPVAPQSQAPAGPTSGPNATVGAGPENAPPYRTAGSDWQPVPQPRPVGQEGQAGQRVDAGPGGDYSHIAGPIRAARGTPEYDGTLAARHAHFNPDPDRVHTDPSGRRVTEREMNTQADHTRGGGSYQTSPNGIRQRAEFVQKLENTRREYAGLDPKSDRARELAGYGGGLMQGLANFDKTGWFGPEGGRGSKPSTPNEGMAAGNLFRRSMEGGGGGGERAPAPGATSDWAPAQRTMAPRPVAGAENVAPTREAPAPATAQTDPENAPPYQTAGKDWEPVPTKPPANTAAPTATTADGATTAAPAEKPPAGPPGAVFAPGAEAAQGGTRPWQPAPNIRGSASVPPPRSDMSPEAEAARQFPGAANQAHRAAYEVQLRRQAREDQLKREGNLSKETIQSAKNQAAWDKMVYQRDSIERVAGGKQAIQEQHYKMVNDTAIMSLIIRHMDANSRMEIQKYTDEIKAGVLTAETPRIRQLMDLVHKRAIEMDLPVPELRPPPQQQGNPAVRTVPPAVTGGGATTGGATTGGSTAPSVATKGAEGGAVGPDGKTNPGHVWTNQWGGGWLKQ
jgi:hypothetical protein